MEQTPLIELNKVCKTFDEGGKKSIRAVKDAMLTINKGDIFGIIGFSGAGKSTLVRLINLLERPTSGQVVVNGRDLTALSEKELLKERRKIGMIFQHFNLMASRTVADNVAFPLFGGGLSRKAQQDKAEKLLELVGLSDKKNAYPSQLSGGQKQRVAIARALANDPSVLLCDEATSALDPQTTGDILRLLRRLNSEMGITIVLITHEMAVVKEVCHRVAVMDNGRIVEEGKLYDIFSAPQMEITRRFIDTASNIRKTEDILETDPALLGVDSTHVVARLDFKEDSTREAIVSRVSKQFDLDISIIFGNVEMVGGLPLGTLVVSFGGSREKVDAAIDYLSEKGVRTEVIRHE